MRKNIVAGNWKMNTTLQEGLELAKGLDVAPKILFDFDFNIQKGKN